MKYAILLAAFITLSCDKNDFVDATVYDFGEPALDGCGWVIEVGSEIYKPTNLASQYQIDQLEIKIDFEKLSSRANCGLLPNAYQEIEINKVK
ncbi:MAG TPA: hypothetical protein DCR48_03255 [Flavobacteriales bacterium]|nr:hypothetical protein [Flavobacteriales bacterium]